MNKWLLTINKIQREFDDFGEALFMFLSEVANHLNNQDIYSRACVPNNVETFFNYKYDERKITDEEIVLEKCLGMLLSYYLSKDPKQIQKNAFKTIKHSFHYHGVEDDIDSEVNINIDRGDKEIKLDIVCNDGDETFFKTNAFVFDGKELTYYFKAHQIVETSSSLDQLGRVVDLDVSLRKI